MFKCYKCGKDKVEKEGDIQLPVSQDAWVCVDCIKIDNHECLNTGDVKRENSIEHPAHYCFSKYEVFDILMAWFPDDPLLYQVGKYIARAKHKGKTVEDLKKARWYLDKAIERGEK